MPFRNFLKIPKPFEALPKFKTPSVSIVREEKLSIKC